MKSPERPKHYIVSNSFIGLFLPCEGKGIPYTPNVISCLDVYFSFMLMVNNQCKGCFLKCKCKIIFNFWKESFFYVSKQVCNKNKKNLVG